MAAGWAADDIITFYNENIHEFIYYVKLSAVSASLAAYYSAVW